MRRLCSKKWPSPHRTEIYIEEAVVNLFEADVVASEEGGDQNPVGVPTDAAIMGDEASLEMPWIGDGLKRVRVGAG